MELSKNGLDLIKSFEGLRLTAYMDSAGIWTTGYGSIMYQSGVAVKEGDTITEQQAEDLLSWEINIKTSAVSTYVLPVTLNQNQFDSLVSFAYNEGCGALHGSTLLKLILSNPSNPAITNQFCVWDKIHVDGQLISSAGLLNRRRKEAELYFTPMN